IWKVRIERPSLDGLTRLALELRGSTRAAAAAVAGRAVRIASRTGHPVRFTVRIRTDAAPLIPLARRDIFTAEFLAFLAKAGGSDSTVGPYASGAVRQRRLEREVRSVELLASQDK